MRYAENPFAMASLSKAFASQQPFFQAWADKVIAWIKQGLKPYVFLHMPNNQMAPLLAAYFYSLLTLSLSKLDEDELCARLQGSFKRPISSSTQTDFF